MSGIEPEQRHNTSSNNGCGICAVQDNPTDVEEVVATRSKSKQEESRAKQRAQTYSPQGQQPHDVMSTPK
jgi:hypothetical protein